jgi:hypothetical protein
MMVGGGLAFPEKLGVSFRDRPPGRWLPRESQPAATFSIFILQRG